MGVTQEVHKSMGVPDSVEIVALMAGIYSSTEATVAMFMRQNVGVILSTSRNPECSQLGLEAWPVLFPQPRGSSIRFTEFLKLHSSTFLSTKSHENPHEFMDENRRIQSNVKVMATIRWSWFPSSFRGRPTILAKLRWRIDH